MTFKEWFDAKYGNDVSVNVARNDCRGAWIASRKQTAGEIIKMLENEFFQGNEIITLSPADMILKMIRKKYLEG